MQVDGLFFSFEKITCAKTSITISFFLCSIYLGKVRFNNLEHYEAITEENSIIYFNFFPRNIMEIQLVL